MPSPLSGLELFTPDEVAECFPGISEATYARLWQLLDAMASTHPIGGDGSNLSVEWPELPEAEHSVIAIWGALSDAERTEINRAYLRYDDLLPEEK